MVVEEEEDDVEDNGEDDQQGNDQEHLTPRVVAISIEEAVWNLCGMKGRCASVWVSDWQEAERRRVGGLRVLTTIMKIG